MTEIPIDYCGLENDMDIRFSLNLQQQAQSKIVYDLSNSLYRELKIFSRMLNEGHSSKEYMKLDPAVDYALRIGQIVRTI